MKVATAFLSLMFLLAACGLGPDMTRDRVERTPTPTPWQGEKSIDEYMREGDAAYSAKNYSAAVAAYQRVYEREQMQAKLDKKLWFGLAENLADSYTQTGDVRNARIVIAQGISKDYKNPMFYYILARTYAQEDNEMQALAHIQKAYENKKNLPAGKTLPDPLTDESFASFADSDDFKKAVSAIRRSN